MIPPEPYPRGLAMRRSAATPHDHQSVIDGVTSASYLDLLQMTIAVIAAIELPSRGLALTDIETDELQDILPGDTEHRPQADVLIVDSGRLDDGWLHG